MRISEKDFQALTHPKKSIQHKEKSSVIRELKLERGVYTGKDYPLGEVIKMML